MTKSSPLAPGVSQSHYCKRIYQPERVIEFAVGQQFGIGDDPGTMKREL